MAVLQKKYGKEDKGGLISSLYDIKEIDQEDRYLLTKCTNNFSDASISIQYKDKKLGALAEDERILLESKAIDSSGL